MNSYNKQALDIIAKEQGFIRDNLEKVILPVLRRSEHFDFAKAKTEVKDFLSKLLVLTESEKEYVREFNGKKYIPELLFEDKEMVNRIKFHPMALWKTRSR